MNRNLLGLLVLSAFLPIFSAEAFLLPPFKLDASTIGNEIVSYGNTSSQTAGRDCSRRPSYRRPSPTARAPRRLMSLPQKC